MGLVRALQPEIFICLSVLVITGAFWWLSARWLLPRLAGEAAIDPGDADIRMLRRWVNRIAILIMVATLLWLACVAFAMSVTNRTDRSDIDRSGVYDQMNSLTKQR